MLAETKIDARSKKASGHAELCGVEYPGLHSLERFYTRVLLILTFSSALADIAPACTYDFCRTVSLEYRLCMIKGTNYYSW